MRKLLALFAFLFCGPAFGLGAGDEVKAYVQGAINDSIERIFSKSLAPEKRVEPFRKVVDENFNFDAIANFVLGVHSRGLDPADKARFITAFRELNIRSYVKKFAGYADQKIDVVVAKPGNKDGEWFVDSRVRAANAGDKDYELVLRVQQAGGAYKVVDIVAEGVSMAMSYRSEYAGVLKAAADEGKPPVPSLTAEINRKIEALKAAK